MIQDVAKLIFMLDDITTAAWAPILYVLEKIFGRIEFTARILEVHAIR